MNDITYRLSVAFFEAEVVIAALGLLWINVRAVRGKSPHRPLIAGFCGLSAVCGALAMGLTLHAAGWSGATPAWEPFFALCSLIPALFAVVLRAGATASDS